MRPTATPSRQSPTVDRRSGLIGQDGDIRLRGVTKRFPGIDSDAVSSLSLEIPSGSIVVLIGPSGCGKTTTLRMINRLIEPSSGSITIGDLDIAAVPATELRRGIGYVIQQVGLFPHRTIRQNIATVPATLGWDRDRTAARIDELAELVGLDPSMLDRYPDELSGGQQQRVGVARALAADPPVLLMDEPFGAVDPIVRGRLQNELLALQEKVNKTIVLVTHDIDEAVKLADRIALLNVGGVLEQYASPDEMLARPANAFVEQFIGDDRGIKRLRLRTVGELTRAQGSVVDEGTDLATARSVLESEGADWLGVTREGAFVGWAPAEQLDAVASIAELDLEIPAAQLHPDATLRTALEMIMASDTSVAVIDDGGRFGGVVTLEHIREGLAAPVDPVARRNGTDGQQ
ncbi:MAG TPA: ATP-binding cassette domain-containing protein [Ilumatobacteraceae bacterium]|nr:ATP-binding cassette domain-containing protein [Ilumatobacteraceae bacterium]